MNFFGLLALALAVVSIVFFIPVLAEYLETGLVPKFPTLIACGFGLIAALQSLFAGLILSAGAQRNRQDFEMNLIRTRMQYKELLKNEGQDSDDR